MHELLTWREHYQRELHAEISAELTGEEHATIPAGQSNGNPPPLDTYRHGLNPEYEPGEATARPERSAA